MCVSKDLRGVLPMTRMQAEDDLRDSEAMPSWLRQIQHLSEMTYPGHLSLDDVMNRLELSR